LSQFNDKRSSKILFLFHIEYFTHMSLSKILTQNLLRSYATYKASSLHEQSYSIVTSNTSPTIGLFDIGKNLWIYG
jgi:hypothetical protein